MYTIKLHTSNQSITVKHSVKDIKVNHTARTVSIKHSGVDKHFKMEFTNSVEVTVEHNLKKRPAVTIIDSAGDEVEAAIDHVSENTLVARFSASFSGVVLCN